MVDLTAADEAAKAESLKWTGECNCHEAYVGRGLEDPTCLFHQVDGMAADILSAAMPHILTALAEEAQADRESSPDMDDAVTADYAALWLNTKAEEAE